MDPPYSNLSTALLLLGSLATPLAVRALPLAQADYSRRRGAVRPAMGFALVVQDLLVGSGIALLAGWAGVSLAQPVLSSLTAAAGIVFAHAVIAADYLIRRQTGIRFSWHFLSYSTLFTISNHHPFEVPAGFAPPGFHCPGNAEKGQFLRTFCYSDAFLGMLRRLLKRRRLERKCVFFILGDTAQPLGEHDNWGVQVGLYEENVRIPC